MEGLILMVVIWLGAATLDPDGAFGGGKDIEAPDGATPETVIVIDGGPEQDLRTPGCIQ